MLKLNDLAENICLVGNKENTNLAGQILAQQSKKLGVDEVTYISDKKEEYNWAIYSDRFFVVKKDLNLEGLMSAMINEVSPNKHLLVIDMHNFTDKNSVLAFCKCCQFADKTVIVLADEEYEYCKNIKCGV